MKCLKAFVYFVFLFFGVQACKKQLHLDTNLSSQASIKIGEVGSMTGSEATFGISTHQGILLALDEINHTGGIGGRKLELITLDDQGKSSEAVLAITKLISQDKVHAILGEVASSLSLAMAPIAQQHQVPMISPSSINSRLTAQGDYIFRVCFMDFFQSKIMANFARYTLDAQSVAILRDIKSDYSGDSAKIFSDFFSRAGGKIVLHQTYSAGDIDFKSQLTAIRALNPDLIFVPGYYTEAALIARQRRELGIKAPLLGGDGWDSPKLKEIGGSDLDGSYFVGHFSADDPSELVQKFISGYKSKFGGISPDGLAALGYDAALLLGDALRRSKPPGFLDLREAITHTREFRGATGKITFGADRNAVKSAFIFRLTNGGNSKLAVRMDPG